VAEPPSRCGFVGIAGRPNVGKSTLVNALVGSSVAIVSDRPQTTRRLIRGVVTEAEAGWQAVLSDLPGVQRPRDEMTARMQHRVEAELEGSDAVLLVIDGPAGVGPGDRWIAGTLFAARRGADVATICAVNKCDRLSKPETVAALAAAAELEGIDEVFPISAKRGEVADLRARLGALMPPGPFLFPVGAASDASAELRFAELIREQALRRTWDEIPHAVDARITSIDHDDQGRLVIEAELWVETESQKGMLIGKGGRMIRQIGTAARKRIETETGEQVHLALQVVRRAAWRRDLAALDRLGIE
jgi:GTP-binding protein Era